MPIMITTLDALENALAEKYPLLYLDELLYRRQRSVCDARLQQSSYYLIKGGSSGRFFQHKPAGTEPDIPCERIFDPLHIL